MRLILNIGLEGIPLDGKSYTNGRENLRDVAAGLTAVQAMRCQGFKLNRAKLDFTPGLEPTLIADAEVGGGLYDAKSRVLALSAALEQDCIAVYAPAVLEGSLVGRNSQAWGEFNPKLFRNFDNEWIAA